MWENTTKEEKSEKKFSIISQTIYVSNYRNLLKKTHTNKPENIEYYKYIEKVVRVLYFFSISIEQKYDQYGYQGSFFPKTKQSYMELF